MGTFFLRDIMVSTHIQECNGLNLEKEKETLAEINLNNEQ